MSRPLRVAAIALVATSGCGGSGSSGSRSLANVTFEYDSLGGVVTECPQAVGTILVTNRSAWRVGAEISVSNPAIDLDGGPWLLEPDEFEVVEVSFNCWGPEDVMTNLGIRVTPSGGAEERGMIPIAIDVQVP